MRGSDMGNREAALPPQLALVSATGAAHLREGGVGWGGERCPAAGAPWDAFRNGLFAWQREQVKRGKCPGEKMSRSRKLVCVLKGKAENSGISPLHLSPCPPWPAAPTKPFLNRGGSLSVPPCGSPVGSHTALHSGLGGPNPVIRGVAGWRGVCSVVSPAPCSRAL